MRHKQRMRIEILLLASFCVAILSVNAQATDSISGIGISFESYDGFPVVTGVFQGSPASKHGIDRGDFIILIDGESTEGKSLEYLASRIRGPVGSDVRISILRNKEIFNFTVTRQRIGGVGAEHDNAKKTEPSESYCLKDSKKQAYDLQEQSTFLRSHYSSPTATQFEIIGRLSRLIDNAKSLLAKCPEASEVLDSPIRDANATISEAGRRSAQRTMKILSD